MDPDPDPGPTTPAQRIAAECARRGKAALVAGCADLLYGRYDDVDDDLVIALGGEPGQHVLGGAEHGKPGYWPRVWAARGLLHAWDDSATDVIIRATADESWRVREMAAKVIARHRVGGAFEAATTLRDDPVPRVRAAAARAVIALTASDA
jgi:hypothetical protein